MCIIGILRRRIEEKQGNIMLSNFFKQKLFVYLKYVVKLTISKFLKNVMQSFQTCGNRYIDRYTEI